MSLPKRQGPILTKDQAVLVVRKMKDKGLYDKITIRHLANGQTQVLFGEPRDSADQN